MAILPVVMVNDHMIVEDLDLPLPDRVEQTLFNLMTCRVVIVEDASLGCPLPT
jgi:hypothetical protein